MSFYPYTITAIAKNTNEGSNIVAGGLVSLLDSNGQPVVMYDDAEGNNGSTGKQCDARGQVTVYLPIGEYALNVNGQANGSFVVTKPNKEVVTSYSTTAQIAALKPKAGDVVENQERANAKYIARDNYTAQPGDITAANGRVWELDTSTPFLELFADYDDAFERLDSVYLKSGKTYTFTNQEIRGTSINSDGTSVIKDGSSTASGYTLRDSTSKKVSISGVIFEGNNEDGVRAGQFLNNESVYFSNVEIRDYAERCFWFEQGCENVIIEGGFYHDLADEAFIFKNKNTTVTGGVYKNVVGHAFRFGRFNNDADEISGEHSTATGCLFDNVQNNPILYEVDARDGCVSNCLAINGRGLIKVESSAGAGDNASHVSITNNRVQNSSGILPTGIDGNESVNLVITGNYVETCYEGISAGASSIISGNTIVDASNQAIRAVGDKIKIEGNLIQGVTTDGIFAQGADSTICNNSVYDCSSEGINISESSRFLAQGNRVSGCNINIRVFSDCTDGVIANNYTNGAVASEISNASATTIDTPNFTI